eukprot:CAMPEP_0202823824 /NCGR_PEP_ID=MMETSP1389-20130828/11942_1 /ASSEMBLY_ACC=CAM_ASM_000865 /TAXON_ID=302021 /ORGANISM="Rhodomonas sp., Strain CCMP768" /LENGTH=380 /DNA_ID=CAMNT_0049496843 /DNA_START=69 /DNA_END=1208 /DNA_ORIENTATION=-
MATDGNLDHNLLHRYLSTSCRTWSSILFTSRPVIASFNKRPIQACIVFLSFGIMLICLRNWMELIQCSELSPRLWKFSILGLRNAPLSALDEVDHSNLFCVKRHGRTLPTQLQSGSDPAEVVLEVQGDVKLVDEWCFRTHADDAAKDATRFAAHVSHDGLSWWQVGSSSSFVDKLGVITYVDGSHATRDARGEEECFGLCAHAGWRMHAAIFATGQWAATVACAVLAISGREEQARRLMGVCLAAVSAHLLALAVLAWSVLGRGQQAEALVLSAAAPAVWAVMVFTEKHFVIGTAAIAALELLVHFLGLDTGPERLAVGVTHVVLVLAGLVASQYRREALREAAQSVAEDRMEFDAVWARIREKEGAELLRLQWMVAGCG